MNRKQKMRVPFRFEPVSLRVEAAAGDEYVDMEMAAQILKGKREKKEKRKRGQKRKRGPTPMALP
jgi:hypothetical protein